MRLPLSADYTSGATIVLVDYPPAREGTATADGTGTATVQFDPVDAQFLWRIERMTTWCSISTQPAAAQFLVYEGPSLLPVRIRDGSSSPALDVADQSAPITLQPSSQLIVQWTGLTPATQVAVSVQFQLWRRIVAGS